MRKLALVLVAWFAVQQAFASPKREDYPVRFTVVSSTMVPQHGVWLSLSANGRIYSVEEQCVLHCYSWRPGTQFWGKIKMGNVLASFSMIELLDESDMQKPKIRSFKLLQIDQSPLTQ